MNKYLITVISVLVTWTVNSIIHGRIYWVSKADGDFYINIIQTICTFLAVCVSLYLGIGKRRVNLIFSPVYVKRDRKINREGGLFLNVYNPEYIPVFLIGKNMTTNIEIEAKYVESLAKRKQMTDICKISDDYYTLGKVNIYLQDLISNSRYYLTIENHSNKLCIYCSRMNHIKGMKIYCRKIVY